MSRFSCHAFPSCLPLLLAVVLLLPPTGGQQAPPHSLPYPCLQRRLSCCCCLGSHSFKFLKVLSCLAESQEILVFRLLYLFHLLLFIICFGPVVHIFNDHDGRILPFNVLFPRMYFQFFVDFMLVYGCWNLVVIHCCGASLWVQMMFH